MSEFATIDPKKKSISYGVILGVISLLVSIISLYILKSATSLFVSSAISIALNYVLFVVIACVFANSLRKYVGGYWDFSTALKNIYIMLAISAIISIIGTSLFNFAMPQVQEESINNTMNLTIESLEKMGTNDEQIDSMVAMLEETKEQAGTISFGQILKGLGVSLIAYFILALVLAAIFKREKPVFIKVESSDNPHAWQDNKDQI